MAARVLVVDDNAVFARALVRVLESRGLEVTWITHGSKLKAALGSGDFDGAIVEAVLPGPSGLRLLELVREQAPLTRVIMTAASATLETAVEAMRRGASDFRLKPVSPEALADSLGELSSDAEGQAALVSESEQPSILGECAAMREILGLVERVAATDAPVLLSGETGTGKELVARAIHRRSGRGRALFLALNCGALSESLLDSELFGHVRGAFSGAASGRRGLFEDAHGGTLFLDEFASTPMGFQARLLRVLEDGEVRPVGSAASRRTDVRIIAASNGDLRELVQSGRLREDLYYRLNVVHIELPALRDRGDDIELLARCFAARFALDLGRPVPELGAGFASLLRRRSWPGNVRELRNVMERAVLLSADGRLDPSAIGGEPAAALPESLPFHSYKEAKQAALQRFTNEFVANLIRIHHGNVSRAARAAGIPRQTLHRLMRSISNQMS